MSAPAPVFAPVADDRDRVVVIVCSGVLTLSLFAMIYVITQRSYLPLKSKNLPLIYISFVAIIFWILGDFYANNSSFMNKDWITCVATLAWLRVSFGSYVFASCVQFRAYSYWLIFMCKKRPTGTRFWLPIIYMAIPPLAYAILAAALPPRYGVAFDPTANQCVTSNLMQYLAIGYLVVQAVVILVLTFMTRGIPLLFNESREMVSICGAIFVAIITSIIIRVIPLADDRTFISGTVSTLLDLLSSQFYLVILLGRPLYHCIVNKSRFLDRFIHTMREGDDGNICKSSVVPSKESPPSTFRLQEQVRIVEPVLAHSQQTIASADPPRLTIGFHPNGFDRGYLRLEDTANMRDMDLFPNRKIV